MLRWRRGWGGVMGVENGVKTEFVPNSELPKQSCLDLYSCKTIIIYAMTYILYAKSVNDAVMKEKKINSKFGFFLGSLFY